MTTAIDVVTATTITHIWLGLGGDPPRHGRARAFWRDGDNPQSVSLNDSKGCWFDHREGVGGGVLDLIQRVHGCDRGAALRWLSDFVGVPLDDHPLTAAERREYARARQEAAELVLWKEKIRDALRAEQMRWWNAYHASLKYVLDHGFDDELGDVMATLHEIAEQVIGRLNHQVDMLADANYTDLLPIFRRIGRRAA